MLSLCLSPNTQCLWHHKTTYIIKVIVSYVWVCMCTGVCVNSFCNSASSELLKMLPCLVLTVALYYDSLQEWTLNVLKGKKIVVKNQPA